MNIQTNSYNSNDTTNTQSDIGKKTPFGLIVKVVIGLLVLTVLGLIVFFGLNRRSDSIVMSQIRSDIAISVQDPVEMTETNPLEPIQSIKPPAYDIFNVKSSNTQLPSANQIKGLVCNGASNGSFVTSIKTKAGNYIDALSISCSDDPLTYDYIGGKGGQIVNIDSKVDGFKLIQTKSGLHVDSISAYDVNKKLINKVGGNGGSITSDMTCGDGAKLVGFTGSYNDYLTTLDIVCSRPHVNF